MDSGASNVVAWVSLVIAVLAVLLPLWREWCKERKLERVSITADAIQLWGHTGYVGGDLPVPRTDNDNPHLALRVANLGKSPVFLRDVRLLFYCRDKTQYAGVAGEFFFGALDKSTDMIYAGQSKYFTVPFGYDLCKYATMGVGYTSLSDWYEFDVEVRGSDGVLWKGRPKFDTDMSECSISMGYRLSNEAKSVAAVAPTS